MKPTQRTYTDVETNEVFRLYSNDKTGAFKLITDGSIMFAKGCEVNGFYIASHTSMDIKLNTGEIIHLDRGQFYNLKENKDNIIEDVTHVKYCGFKKFRRVG